VSADRQAAARQRLNNIVRRSLVAILMLATSCEERAPVHEKSPRKQVQRAAQSSPKLALEGRVNDAAKLLSEAQVSSLSRQLESLERDTQHQMVVVTVPTLGGEEIATFTRELGNSWGIGRAQQDDGVILLIAPNERKVRIAVGYGLEGKLPDEVCQQILDREIIPLFKEGDLPGGIEAGVEALITRLRV